MIRRFLFFIPLATLCATTHANTFLIDDFDNLPDSRVTSRVIAPDTLTTPFVSIFDVFGIADRTQNFDFADDSVSIFPGDNFGIVPEGKTDFFFGVEDLDNPGNVGGTGTATWTINISGLSNLSISAVFSAMGDFEAGDNSHTFTASIDGGAAQTLISIDADESIDPFTYTMEDGVTTNDLNDPLRLTDALGSRIIDNTFTTSGTAIIAGTGNVLTLVYTAGVNNGGGEPFAFDDLILSDEGVVLPDADFDDDTDVDGDDLATWERAFGGAATGTTGDADGDGDADGRDFIIWQKTFTGVPQLSGVTAVPEPASFALLALAMGLASLRRSR